MKLQQQAKKRRKIGRLQASGEGPTPPADLGPEWRVYCKVRKTSVTLRLDACPASSILSGQRQLDFPMLFEIPAAVGAVGKVGIARVVRDFQGRWEGRKTCFWFSSLSTDRLFPQPGGRRVLVFETWVVT